MTKQDKHSPLGSSFNEFLHEEGIYEEVTLAASKKSCRSIVTLLKEPEVPETALLSQQALEEDWQRPEEDEAWSHLQ